MFSSVSPEALVPTDHPLRPIRVLVNRTLERLSGEFDTLCAAGGQDSIAPEKLPRGLDRVGWSFTLRVTAYNLVRFPRLLAAPA